MSQPLNPDLAPIGSGRSTLPERFGIALLLAGATLVWWFWGSLALPQKVVLVGTFLLSVAVVLRRGWIKLFGPVLFFDLVRTTRNGRQVALRCLYACGLLFLLYFLYSSWFPSRTNDLERMFAVETMQGKDMPRFAGACFTMFMGMQFLVVLVLTPAYTAGAITEEKERRTLEFLLATDLTNREIVLSKLVSRLATMAIVVIAGLPVLCLMQFLGGVDPDLVLSGFALTGLTMLSLGTLSILVSVYSRRTMGAVFKTYLYAILYVALSFCIPGVNMGNPIMVLYKLQSYIDGAAGLAGYVLIDVVRNYAIFHILVSFLLVRFAIRGLRMESTDQSVSTVQALREEAARLALLKWRAANTLVHRQVPPGQESLSGVKAEKEVPVRALLEGTQTSINPGWGPHPEHPLPRRPTKRLSPGEIVLRRPRFRVTDEAMLWKEIHGEPGFGSQFGEALLIGSILFGVFVGLPFLALILLNLGSGRVHGETANQVVRVAGTTIACPLLLMVAFAASGRLSRERERQTLESLLTTPLESEEILYAKLAGSIVCVRWGWRLLGMVMVMGLISGGLHLLACPLLVAACAVYAAFAASLGLWFSASSPSTLRATLLTLLSLLALTAGPLLLASVAESSGSFFYRLEAFGLAPPVTLWVLAFHYEEFLKDQTLASSEILRAALLGVLLYAVAAWTLWQLTLARFRRETNRESLPRSEPPQERESLAVPASELAPD